MDRTTRRAALWATLVALPLTVLLAFLLAGPLAPGRGGDDDPVSAGRAGPSTPTSGSTGTASLAPVPAAPVRMAAAPLTERQAVVCRALLSHLPAAVRQLPQRPVTAGPEQNAAYGEPALTVACGTPPAGYPPTDDVWTVNRVCWHAAQQSEAVVLSTVDREVPVRVTVPRSYEPALQWVSEISEALVASVPSAKTAPAGCQRP